MVDEAQVASAFAAGGYRLTAQRQALAALISARDGHFTAEELLFDARKRRLPIGRATVFRSLEVLGELGLIERIDLPHGGHAFLACRPQHHHHLVCTSCGGSREIAATGLSTILRELGQRTGYRIDNHRLEVFGVCPTCQRGVSGAGRGHA